MDPEAENFGVTRTVPFRLALNFRQKLFGIIPSTFSLATETRTLERSLPPENEMFELSCRPTLKKLLTLSGWAIHGCAFPVNWSMRTPGPKRGP